MKNIRPIRGAQEPPLPNNVQAECICVPKVYDFVVFTEDINSTVPITPTPDCPTTVTDIDCALVTEPFFPISFVTNVVCTVLDRRPINIDGVNAALVKLRQDIPVDVTFTGTNATGAPASCTIRVLVPFIRQVVLCFPPEFTNDNLICRIISGDCIVTTPPPAGGQTFPASVRLELKVCKEIQVLAAVKLEVLAKFCSPRGPITPPTAAICPTLTFPQQCDIFPIPNCECQATFNATCSLVDPSPIPTCAMELNGTVDTSGLITLSGFVCNNCVPQNSSINFTFSDTSIPDNSFTFRAITFNVTCPNPLAPEAISMQVTGTGTVMFTPGSTIDVTYILDLSEEGPCPIGPNCYQLRISGLNFQVTVLNLEVADDDLIIQNCVTLSEV
jgi:hypothetical protein